jgi:hypothetical protein
MMRFFKEQWEANPGVYLAALPRQGALDIRQVLFVALFLCVTIGLSVHSSQ